MKALLLKEYKKLEIVDWPEPECGPDELLVRVRACGICGSDVHGYDGSSGRRIPPIIMGHEAAGEVAAVGKEVKNLKVGDRVTFDSTIYCGNCHYCRRGEINLCDNRRVLGVSCGDYRQHGAFAEFVVVPERVAFKLPDNLPFEHAAMVEPVSIAVHAVNRTPVKLGDTALVVGTGIIGLLVIQALKLAGCGKIIAVDLDASKLELALKLGADNAFNARTCDMPRQIIALTNGRGVDVAVEAVGAAGPVQMAIASLRKGGSLTMVGNVTPAIEVPLQSIVTKELTLFGSCASNGEYPVCIDMIANGRIKVAPLISVIAPLENGPSLFERLHGLEKGMLKVILRP